MRPAGWVTFLSRKAEWELTNGEWEEELSRWKKQQHVQIREGGDSAEPGGSVKRARAECLDWGGCPGP